MKRKIFYAIILIILFALILGGWLAYRKAVNVVVNQIEDAQKRVAAQNDGSILEWSEYKVAGRGAEMFDFHYYNAKEKYEIWADRLQMDKRIGVNYSGEFDNLTVQSGTNDQIHIEQGVLENFNTAEDFSDFEVETANLVDFRWVVSGRRPVTLSMDKVVVENLKDLHMQTLDISNIHARFEDQNFDLNSANTEIKDLTLISHKKYFELAGVAYRQFTMENVLGAWHDVEIMKGEITSKREVDEQSQNLVNGNINLNLNIKINLADFDSVNLTNGAADTMAFLRELNQPELNGHWVFDGRLKDGTHLEVAQNIKFDDLGEAILDARLTGYTSQFLKDLEGFNPGDTIPMSFNALRLESANLTYKDGKLADFLFDKYINTDPALVSFFIQMSLPQYFPKDPGIVQELGAGLRGFLKDKNGFEIDITPPQAISVSDMMALYQTSGPYQQFMGIHISGE